MRERGNVFSEPDYIQTFIAELKFEPNQKFLKFNP